MQVPARKSLGIFLWCSGSSVSVGPGIPEVIPEQICKVIPSTSSMKPIIPVTGPVARMTRKSLFDNEMDYLMEEDFCSLSTVKVCDNFYCVCLMIVSSFEIPGTIFG